MGTDDIKKDLKAKQPRINEKIRQAFHQDLASWYRAHARDLPWRRTGDPYAIALSEFMLQQTQVVTVIPYYQRWLQQFPDWSTLAAATEAQVLKAWEGLGYYSRARNLHRLATQVVNSKEGLPSAPEELVKLAGIGPYTAGAIASLAFRQRAALLDGNVMRVFARVFNLSANITERSTQQMMWVLAEQLLPSAEDCAGHNSALMELGATVCTPNKPHCLTCPLRGICQATEPELLPVKTRIQTEKKEEEIALLTSQDRWWLEPGPSRGRLAGFWRFPAFNEETMERGEIVDDFTYGITRYRIHLRAYRATFRKLLNGRRSEKKLLRRVEGKELLVVGTPGLTVSEGKWFSPEEMNQMTMSASQRRLREVIKKLSRLNG